MLIDDRLTYIQPTWDGKLYSEPGVNSPTTQLPRQWFSLVGQTINYVRAVDVRATSDGQMWIRVHFRNDFSCGDPLAGAPEIEGWIPAYDSKGTRNMWFYSRGC